MSPEQIVNIVVMATVFGLVLSVWSICVFLWFGQHLMHQKKVQTRLGIAEQQTAESRTLSLWRQICKDAEGAEKPKKPTLRNRCERLRSDAGWRAPAQSVILGVVGLAILAFVVTCVSGGGVFLGAAIATAIVVSFWVYTGRCITKRAAMFERQFLDALSVAARALRAGHPLVGAFQLVSEEVGEPLGSVFSQICQQQALGLDLKDSIRKVAETTHNTELKLFATAVAIQLRSGGNLADLMDSLGVVIRARMRLNQRVRVITAQTQFSKNVLIALPIVLFFLLNHISPGYMQPFFNTIAGRYMLAAAGASILLGSWAMHRLAALRF
jgi:tight adherence protein B